MINAFGIEFNLIFTEGKLQHKNAIIKSKNIKILKILNIIFQRQKTPLHASENIF